MYKSPDELSPPPLPTGVRVSFTGCGNDFTSLVLRGGLLELATLAFYRFWLVTDIRRHLWSRTSAGDDALEYAGQPKELLFGFLVALAVLVPFYLAFAWLGLEAERLAAFASLPLLVLFYGLYEFAIYRSRRYRLTRTLWRGTRFWMDGSGAAYAWRAILWGLLTILTLGLAFPWRAAALERYKMSHTYYGDLPGRFEGTGWSLFKRVFWIWLVVVAVFATPPLIAYYVARITGGVETAGERSFSAWHWAVVLVFVAAPFMLAIFKAIEWKWWLEGLRVGNVRFDSDLRTNALVGTIWKFVGVAFAILCGVMLMAFAGSMIAIATLGTGQMSADGAAGMGWVGAIASIVLYVIVALAMVAVQRIYLLGRVWKIVASSIIIDNLDSAEHAVGKGAPAGVLGEGIVDTLDFAGF